jgi:hypothetical protein
MGFPMTPSPMNPTTSTAIRLSFWNHKGHEDRKD